MEDNPDIRYRLVRPSCGMKQVLVSKWCQCLLWSLLEFVVHVEGKRCRRRSTGANDPFWGAEPIRRLRLTLFNMEQLVNVVWLYQPQERDYAYEWFAQRLHDLDEVSLQRYAG